MADSFEQSPRYWSFFEMSDEDYRKKEDLFEEKGWDMEKVPTHSGKMTLPDGTVVRFEGRETESQNGTVYWTGTCYIPENQGGGGGRSRGGDRRSRGRDDRGGGRDRGRDRGDDRRGSRDSRDRDERRSRDRGRDSGRQSFDNDLDDDVPF